MEESFEDILKEAKEETIARSVKKVNIWLAGFWGLLFVSNLVAVLFFLEFGIHVFLAYTLLSILISVVGASLIALVPFIDWPYHLLNFRILLFALIIFQGIFLSILSRISI